MNINGEFIAFFIFSVLAIGGAVFMINLTRVMHMALALAFTFFSIAGLYVLLDAPFLAVIQILIYTGAVSILMIFGIMLTKHKDEDKVAPFTVHKLLSLLGVGGFLAIVIWIIYRNPFFSTGEPQAAAFKVTDLGKAMFKTYMIPFEVTSILLLVALIGAIVLAKREEKK
ncbi:NADH-quinone oxidoreductase subunit J [Thermoflavimicrobium dichotomicum]|uniref:NADH-quinone oxidoreductase subunit J n=1 Tax=Thermoflavimicrobium dichotomicum TaxID=46223 RepID=A0A1I3K149_9BACL|nr:NADH-quinone oxidoreductase subunit J [Thermoflavimicrobium dichotomicum]SFI66221.1 NADH-quinone oxidoreductase subunit J [Thermoflavimicrobium dichotomicum]